jgi:hypothetical protein
MTTIHVLSHEHLTPESGLDGIINEFYRIYWDTIKEDLFEVLLEVFDKFKMNFIRYIGIQ